MEVTVKWEDDIKMFSIEATNKRYHDTCPRLLLQVALTHAVFNKDGSVTGQFAKEGTLDTKEYEVLYDGVGWKYYRSDPEKVDIIAEDAHRLVCKDGYYFSQPASGIIFTDECTNSRMGTNEGTVIDNGAVKKYVGIGWITIREKAKWEDYDLYKILI